MSVRAIPKGIRSGAEVQLPLNLDAIAISTSIGTIQIDLTGPVPDMLLVFPAVDSDHEVPLRLIPSPMPSSRLALGVIRAR